MLVQFVVRLLMGLGLAYFAVMKIDPLLLDSIFNPNSVSTEVQKDLIDGTSIPVTSIPEVIAPIEPAVQSEPQGENTATPADPIVDSTPIEVEVSEPFVEEIFEIEKLDLTTQSFEENFQSSDTESETAAEPMQTIDSTPTLQSEPNESIESVESITATESAESQESTPSAQPQEDKKPISISVIINNTPATLGIASLDRNDILHTARIFCEQHMEAWRIAPESLDSYCTNPVADHVYLVAIGDFVYPPRETQERNDLSTSGMEFDSTQSSDMNSQEAFDQDVHKNSVESVATESKIEEAAMAPEVASTKEEFQRQPEQMDPTPVTQEPIATEQIASRDDTPPPSQDSEIRQSPPEVRRPVIREFPVPVEAMNGDRKMFYVRFDPAFTSTETAARAVCEEQRHTLQVDDSNIVSHCIVPMSRYLDNQIAKGF